MALDLHEQWFLDLAQLRCSPTAKRLRASRHGEVVVDTTEGWLVWEPTRVVPEYAVPSDAFAAGVELVDLPRREVPADLPRVLGPAHFEWHTCAGTPVALRPGSVGEPGPAADLVEIGFRPDDPDLGGRVVLDFARFDWLEEDQPVIGHAHDPYKRIDVLRSHRHVVVSLADGTVLADSRNALAVYETALPTRWYVPVADVATDLLTPSSTHTVCAYKGEASYLSAGWDGGDDVAWYYPEPLDDAVRLVDHIAFWSERCVVTVDGLPVSGGMPDAERPSEGSL
jgi:uncharacterized protein (DUF427 family)